jgi:Kef-type K+ transport system membrane component KefB
MIPRGEVGLIFAQIGLASQLITGGLYSAVALMVMITTFITPPLLRLLLVQGTPTPMDGVASELVMDAPMDREDRP